MPADPSQTHVAKEFAHERPWISCRFHSHGQHVFAGAEDFRVWRVDLESGAKTAFAVDAWVRAIGFCADNVLLTGGYDGRLLWWPALADSPQRLREVAAHDGWLRALVVSPDGQTVATCGNDRAVRLWRTEDGTLVRELTGLEAPVHNLAIHPQGKDLVAGDRTAHFVHWELDSGNVVRRFHLPVLHKYDTSFLADYGGPYSMGFRPDGRWLACGGITNVSNAFAGVGNPAVSIVDWETAAEKAVHLSKGAVQGKAWGLALHPEGFDIAATGGPGGGHLFFWKPEEKDEFHTLNLGSVARDLDLHHDGVQLVTAHHDGKLRISRMAPKPA